MNQQLGLNLFHTAFWIYVVSAVCYAYGFLKNKPEPARLGRLLMLTAAVIHTASFVTLWIALGRPPFLNLYEYMLSFTCAAAIVYVVTETLTRNTSVGAFFAPLITCFVYLTQKLPNARIDEAVMPALRSAWRVPHVTSAILAYGAFLLAFILAVLYLVKDGLDKSEAATDRRTTESFWLRRLPDTDFLDRLIYRTIAFGFLMQTLLVVVGAIWAQYAWGRFWGWDPKETWSFITWIIYATYLHTRTSMGWKGRRSAWVAIIGFGAVAFTLLGVSYLLKGLHSYAT